MLRQTIEYRTVAGSFWAVPGISRLTNRSSDVPQCLPFSSSPLRPFSLCSFLLVCLSASGCGKGPPPAKPINVEPKVGLVKPEIRTVAETVGQPGYIYAYEQTALYPKVSGYIEEWKVDIGDTITKDQVLATIYDPELIAEFNQKKAQVVLDEVQIKVAERMVEVASRNVQAAAAQVKEAQANIGKYHASVERWESEVKRLTSLAEKDRVIDQQILAESKKQLQADTAARDAAKAAVIARQADELARQADLDKAKADVDAARAKAKVSLEDEQRVAALVGYLHIVAPYDGVVVIRNVNKGDYVQPSTGDETVRTVAPGQITQHVPLYEVARTDKVRVYVDVPEMEANWVTRGTKATVRVQALSDDEIPGTVTRTSWALNRQSRTLRAEIDLPNPEGELRPGMYAYGNVLIERRKVRAIPASALIEIGNENCCFLYEDGKAVQTAVQTGISDGKWTEVNKKRVNGRWVGFTGDEEVILGDLSELTDGQSVVVDKAKKEG